MRLNIEVRDVAAPTLAISVPNFDTSSGGSFRRLTLRQFHYKVRLASAWLKQPPCFTSGRTRKDFEGATTRQCDLTATQRIRCNSRHDEIVSPVYKQPAVFSRTIEEKPETLFLQTIAGAGFPVVWRLKSFDTLVPIVQAGDYF